MRRQALNILCDVNAEKSVLAACYNYGRNTYIDIAEFLSSGSFVIEHNQIFFALLKHIFEVLDAQKPDIALFHSAAKDLGVSYQVNKKDCASHITQIIDFSCEQESARTLAIKLKKLEIARLLDKQLERAKDKLLDVTGNESITNILGIAENAIFNFSDQINDDNNEPVSLEEFDLEGYFNDLVEKPVDQIGISTGLRRWDATIGGGLRNASVNVIGARAKGFKSGFAINVANHVCDIGLPVLYMDTEMSYHEQMNRLMARRTQVGITEIETGQYGKNPITKRKVESEILKIRNKILKFYHRNIAGVSFEEQLATIRRWIFRRVGVNGDGTAKPCLIIYDYLKLMDTSLLTNLKEYQALGFMMTNLHNFAVKYNIPILSFVQLNRDGITRETSDVMAQSDRIGWLCSNFSILKPKSDEEIEQDEGRGGNFKLLPVLVRHGPGLDSSDYINLYIDKKCARMREGLLKSEIIAGQTEVDLDGV